MLSTLGRLRDNKRITAESNNHNKKDLLATTLALVLPIHFLLFLAFLLFPRKSFSLYSGFEVFHLLDVAFSLLPYPTLPNTREF